MDDVGIDIVSFYFFCSSCWFAICFCVGTSCTVVEISTTTDR